jgi:hypothetical protein
MELFLKTGRERGFHHRSCNTSSSGIRTRLITSSSRLSLILNALACIEMVFAVFIHIKNSKRWSIEVARGLGPRCRYCPIRSFNGRHISSIALTVRLCRFRNHYSCVGIHRRVNHWEFRQPHHPNLPTTQLHFAKLLVGLVAPAAFQKVQSRSLHVF